MCIFSDIFHQQKVLIALSVNSDGSRALSANSASELHVLGHDGDAFGVDSAQVGVLEEADHVGLRGLLEGKDGRALETELVAVLAGDLTDEALEGEFPDEELGGLLEASDLTESDGARSEAMRLLDAGSGGRGLLGSSLVRDVLARVLGAGVLASGLLGAGHCYFLLVIDLKRGCYI